MSDITITDIDDELRQRLKQRAAQHGRSMQAEARDILQDALGVKQPLAAPDNLYEAIRAIVEPLGGIELEPFPRQPVREPPNFE
jgi:plasmid stability protein